jgi:multidrug efflux pump subunit AcrA (membrane-fusion protein)
MSSSSTITGCTTCANSPNQLKSTLDQAEANQRLAQVTWGRDAPLVEKGWVTRQQGDVDLQNLKAPNAAVDAAAHNVTAQENVVKQLRQDRDYASVVAPFDGVITQPNVDVGSLAQGNATSGTFMFEIMQEDVIRVSAFVPQDAAFGVAPSTPSCACQSCLIASSRARSAVSPMRCSPARGHC